MAGKMQGKDKCILIALAALSLLAAVVKIFVGFDIDEGYAVSMPYRLLQGDKLFRDMWEVHQTSSFLPAAFLYIYHKITGGMESAVLYLRVVATLLHGGMSYLVWRGICRKADTKWSVLLALLYFNLLPKWLISLDFSMQQVWGITLVLLLLQKEVETGKKRYSFGMGILLAVGVLAYPGMVLCYPALLFVFVFYYKNKEIKFKLNKCILFTSGCVVMAGLFFAYVLSAMSLGDFIESIPMVFMDGTHQFTLQTKLMLYVTQWLNVLKQILILSAPSVIITCVIYKALPHIMKKTTKKSQCFKDDADDTVYKWDWDKETFFLCFLLSFVVVTSLLVIAANLFGIQMGPFHFQVRYLMFFGATLIWCFYRIKVLRDESRTEKELFWGPFFLMLVSFVAILIFSNVGPDSSSSYLSVGIIAGWMLFDYASRKKGEKWNRAGWYVSVLFVLSLVFCKGYYVRITEYGPSTIMQERQQISEGPLKGIYVLPEDYVRVTGDYRTIQETTEGEERLLYLGTEGISNLYAKCSFVSPSTISTPAFNEQWVSYFEMYPEKEPTVIVLAKNTIDNREKFFAENPFGKWIAEKYDILHMEETDSLCIIRRK